MASLATLAQLQARHTVTDDTKAQARLDDASALIRATTGNSWTVGEAVSGQVNTQLVSLDADGLLTAVPDLLIGVCCDVAARALENPTGLRDESLGEYRAGYATARLTEDDRRALRRLRHGDGLQTVAFTRDLGGPVQTLDVVYVGGAAGEPMPWSDEL